MPPPTPTTPAVTPATPAGPQGGAPPISLPPVGQPPASGNSTWSQDPFGDKPAPATPAQPSPAPQPAVAPPQAPVLQPAVAPQPAPVTPPAAEPAVAPGQPAATPTTSGQPAVGAQPAQPATAAPAAPAAPAPATEQDISARLPQDSKVPPEQRAEFSRGMATWLNDPKNKDALQGANDLKAGKNTPQAQQFNAAMEQRQKEFTEERTRALAAADPKAAATPQGWAGMFGQASQQWDQMPQEMKMVMGLGLGGGLLGMASSMFGEGGMGMGILGLLGIGGGLASGAAGGMFGQGAQKFTSDMAYNVGSFFGAVPDAGSMGGKFNQLKGPDALKQLSAPPTVAEKLQAYRFPKQEQARVREQLAMADKVKDFMRVPAPMRANWLQKMDPTLSPQEAATVAQNLESMATQMGDAQSPLAQKIQTGQAFANAEDPSKYVNQQATNMVNDTTQQAKTIGSHVANGLRDMIIKPRVKKNSDKNMNINKLIEKWAFNAMDAKELNDLKAEEAKGVPYRVESARRENKLQMRQEAAAPSKEVVMAACKKAAADATTACSCGCGSTVATCKCGSSCSCRKPGGSCCKPEKTTKESATGLWDRIRAKKKRGESAAKPGDKDYPNAESWKKVTTISEKKSGSPAWQRSAGKNEEGGLNEKGRKSYENEHGGNLKPPVTESNPSGDRAKRQNSFCSRMCGMKSVNTGAATAKDPDSRINKSLRKWNCKCSSAMDFGIKLARCWSGYEPVPGAKKFSKGSCRPKGSKKTQKEMKKS